MNMLNVKGYLADKIKNQSSLTQKEVINLFITLFDEIEDLNIKINDINEKIKNVNKWEQYA